MDGNDYSMRSLQVLSAAGIGSDLLLRTPARSDGVWLYWLPAMGVPARNYAPLAEALAARGVGLALHEWRGLGSSSVRAGRNENWGYRELLTQDVPAGLAIARKACPEARWLIGGHSLGGQLASLFAGLQPETVDGLVLVASGAPYWRCFPRWSVPLRLAYGLAPGIARLRGHFPGRRIGFGGNEARGVIADWAHSGRRGHYAAQGLSWDLDDALQAQKAPVLALRLVDDAFGPRASLQYLLDKMPRAISETHALDAEDLGNRPDHFSWMKTPEAVARHIADWSDRLR